MLLGRDLPVNLLSNGKSICNACESVSEVKRHYSYFVMTWSQTKKQAPVGLQAQQDLAS